MEMLTNELIENQSNPNALDVVTILVQCDSSREFIETITKKGSELCLISRKELCIMAKITEPNLSLFIKGKRGITLQQALLIAKAIHLGDEETDLFLDFVLLERESDPEVSALIYNRINKKKKAISSANKLSKNKPKIGFVQKAIYYSNWHFPAIREALSLPHLRTEESLSNALDIDPEKVSDSLEFLMDIGACFMDGNSYRSSNTLLHLTPESGWINSYYRNLRVKALEKLDQKKKDLEFQYSAMISISAEDSKNIKETLRTLCVRATNRAKDSKAEELMLLNVDFLSLLETQD